MVIKAQDFNLRHTLESGQCFSWEKYKKGYAGIINNTFIYIYQKKENLYIFPKGININNKKIEKSIKKYFSLDVEYNKILREIDKDKYINNAIKKYHGIRVVKQAHFECFICFLLSANNNVKKIQLSRRLISEKYGDLIYKEKNKKFYSFPTFNQLKIANEQDLRECKAGFRAKYIYMALQALNENYLKKIEKMPYQSAKDRLIKLKGIGEKIADCILLYSYNFDNIYPTDTWVKKFTKEIYLKDKKVNENEIREFGTKYFYPFAGWAQLFLYIYYRENKI